MAKTKTPRHGDYSRSVATKRRDDALRAALSMPANPHARPKQKARPSKKQKAPK